MILLVKTWFLFSFFFNDSFLKLDWKDKLQVLFFGVKLIRFYLQNSVPWIKQIASSRAALVTPVIYPAMCPLPMMNWSESRGHTKPTKAIVSSCPEWRSSWQADSAAALKLESNSLSGDVLCDQLSSPLARLLLLRRVAVLGSSRYPTGETWELPVVLRGVDWRTRAGSRGKGKNGSYLALYERSYWTRFVFPASSA